MHSNYNLAIDQSCHRHPGLTKSFLIQMVCNENFGPGQKVVWVNNFCRSTLAAKIGPTQPKMVRSRNFIEFMSLAACM